MKILCAIFLLAVAIAIPDISISQPFTDINANIAYVAFSQAGWADYDNDGDLDILVFGMNAASTYETHLYRNDGNDTFTEISPSPFIDVALGSFSWADYDNDGDLDLLIQGADNSISAVTKLYQNKGNDVFTEVSTGIIQVYDGSVRWADYNNDGYVDMLVNGFDDEQYVAKIYRNNQDGTFSEETSANLTGAIKSSIEWADYDKDGDMDFVFTGFDLSGTLTSVLYKNTGNGSFVDSELQIPGVWLGDVAWGDYDMDGYIDLIVSGFDNPGRITKLYHNTGTGSFEEVSDVPFEGVSHSSLEWGDYDNDGDLDLFLAGVYETGGWVYVTKIYDNNGEGTFSESTVSLPNILYWGDASWGDYDNDGDIDLIQTGYTSAGETKTVVYRNDNSLQNSAPTSPLNLGSTVVDADVTLSWEPATDNETGSDGLTYNGYIRDENGNIVWSSSSLESGLRLLPAIGNTTQNLSWTIAGLADAHYFWSVQAVDNCFEGSEFAEEGEFTIGTTSVDDQLVAAGIIYPNPSSGEFQIDLKGFTDVQSVSVINESGQEIFLAKNPKQLLKVDIELFGKGLYLVRIITIEKTYSGKLIVR